MIRNYLKIALRSMGRSRTYSFINIVGLAVGFTSVLLITSFVLGELSYDQFHTKKNLVFRVVNDYTDPDSGEITEQAYTYAPVAKLINGNIQGVKRVLRIHEKQGLIWKDGQEKFIEKNFLYADSSFFHLFDVEFLRGGENALKTPFSVVLTASTALKYFGSSNPIGQKINNQDDNGINQLVVTGVIKDLPENTHLEADLISSMSTLQKTQPWNFYWYFPPMYTYVEFQAKPNLNRIEQQITSHIQTNLPEGYGEVNYQLQNLGEIYLHSNREGEFRATGNYPMVVVLIIIAGFILFIAAVNFINLSTARSFKRAKEVGMRKALGAQKKQLVFQFLSESILTVIISFLLSIVLLLPASSLFEQVIDKPLQFEALITWEISALAVLTLLLVGLLSGLYPAIYLSSFKPSKVLRQQYGKSRGKLSLRKGLVITQFVVSSVLILGTLIIYQQMTFMTNKKLGFKQEELMIIPLEETKDQKNYELLQSMIQSHSTVVSASMTSGVPGTDGFYGFGYNIGTATESISIPTLGTDEAFIDTYQVKVLEGRPFSKDISGDKNSAFMVNEAALKRLSWDDALGKELTLNYYLDGPVTKKGKVIGVIEDFHYESLYHRIEPLIIHLLPPSYYSQYLTVRLKTDKLINSASFLEETWQQFNPNRPFEYYFLNESLNQSYQTEKRLTKTLTWFSGLAIFISCLGLIGLAAFTAEQKTKEIGIRKVMGANVLSIIRLISREYLILIVIANLLAFPIAWKLMNDWLNGFAYRTVIQWDVFLITATSVLVIGFAAIGLLTLKAAKTDPINSLRYE